MLPWLGISLYPDAVSFYWWVSDDGGWDPDSVAALAKLIGDIRVLAPKARIELEWGGEDEFFFRVDAYLGELDDQTGHHPALLTKRT